MRDIHKYVIFVIIFDAVCAGGLIAIYRQYPDSYIPIMICGLSITCIFNIAFGYVFGRNVA